MNFFELKRRVSDILLKDNMDSLIASYINEVREEPAKSFPLKFLFTKKTIDITASTYEYAFDKNESTGRYSGFFQAVYYDDNSGNNPIRLGYLEDDIFESIYNVQDTGDPSAFSVRGNDFIVNLIPEVITDKTFISAYYALPDVMRFDSSEDYMSKNYHNYIIHRTCFRMYQEIIELGEVNKSAYHLREYEKDYDKMILKEGRFNIIDNQKNVFFPSAGG